jgi:hypothetical protein
MPGREEKRLVLMLMFGAMLFKLMPAAPQQYSTKQKAAFHNMLIMQTRGAQVFSNPFCTLPSCGNNFLSLYTMFSAYMHIYRRFGQS